MRRCSCNVLFITFSVRLRPRNILDPVQVLQMLDENSDSQHGGDSHTHILSQQCSKHLHTKTFSMSQGHAPVYLPVRGLSLLVPSLRNWFTLKALGWQHSRGQVYFMTNQLGVLKKIDEGCHMEVSLVSTLVQEGTLVDIDGQSERCCFHAVDVSILIQSSLVHCHMY